MTGLRGALSLLVLMATACDVPERTLIGPAGAGPGEYIFTLRPHPGDRVVAEELGWGDAIPLTEVRLVRRDAPDQEYVSTSEIDGRVLFTGIERGDYTLSVKRLLDDEELELLTTGVGAIAFVLELDLTLTTGTRTRVVDVPASFRRSLMISEWGFNRGYGLIGNYRYGGFLELYNNSDTTVYLDGMLIGDVFVRIYEFPIAPCSVLEPWRNDPNGIWTIYLASFPGTGQQYPLLPGETTVIATDAIDHRPISPFPHALDLRNADFEFIGSADVDNPAVPNMRDHSPRVDLKLHGLDWWTNTPVAVIALPSAPSSWTSARLPPNDDTFIRINGDDIIDVFASLTEFLFNQQPPPAICTELVNSRFERQHGIFIKSGGAEEYAVSMSRKVLTTLPDGRHVLQHTRMSANDFRRGPLSPGVVEP